jgi:hypothetical protein
MKSIVALIMICSSAATLAMSAPVRAEMSSKTVGPSLMIGNGTTSIGVDSRFGVSDNLSVRPFVFFPSGATVFGSSLTYDFESSKASKFQMTPYLGGGVSIGSANNGGASSTNVFFTGGADFSVTDSVDLKAALEVPLTSSNASTNVRLGAGFRF